MNKKILALISIVCIICLSVLSPVFADASQELDDVIVVETNFIKSGDLQIDESGAFIFTRTIKKSDINTLELDASKTINIDLLIEKSTYLQEQMIILPLNLEAKNEIEQTISDIRNNIDTRDNTLLSLGGGSVSVYTDLSGAAVAYLMIEYSCGTYDGRDTIWMTRSSGHYTVNSSTVAYNQELTLGQSGYTTVGLRNQSQTYTKSTNYWTQYPPSSWYPPLYTTGSGNFMGGWYTVYFYTGNSQHVYYGSVTAHIALQGI